MTTTENKTTSAPRTARLARRSRRGLIMNLSVPQAITLLGAVLLVAATVPLAGIGVAFWVALLAGGPLTALALLRWDGFPLVEWSPILWHYWRRTRTRQNGFRATATPRAAGRLALPGQEARLVTLTAPDGSVTVHDPWTGGYTAVLRLRAPAFLLLDPETQDAQVSGWGRVLAGICQSNLISRIQVLEQCVPDSGDGLRDYHAQHAHGQDLSEWASENYRDLMDIAGPASSRSDVLLALTLDSKRCRGLIRKSGGGHPGALKVLAGQPPGLNVQDYLAEWLTHIERHVRPSTLKAYRTNCRLHIVPRIGRTKLAKLTVRDVRLMLDDLRAKGAGARTVQYVHATLRAALEHAYREELVSRNVAKMVRVERPKTDSKEPLSVDEARKLLTATRDDEDHALWVVMLMLGLRRSEVCGLRWDNVDLDNRTLSVTHSVQRVDGELRELPTKTRRSTRTIPLPALARDALAEHRARTLASRPGAPAQVYVFGTRYGTPMEPRNLTRKWTKLAEREGIRRVNLHGLRHACVSLLLSLGVNPRTVMEIVGHSALEMTMNVYGHVNLDTQRRALDELDQSLR